LLHSINQGVYGGGTLFTWEEEKQAVVYYYFTTASYMTTGRIEVKEGKTINHEEVKGEAGGITEVRGTSQFLPDGRFHLKAEHFENGQWVLWHKVTYAEDASSQVVVNTETQSNAENRREKELSATLCKSLRLCAKSSQYFRAEFRTGVHGGAVRYHCRRR
jgi:hypothetical protein